MKPLIASALLATSLLSGPGLLLSAAPASAQPTCAPDSPPAYFRPGGYCANLDYNRSLTLPGDGPIADCIVSAEPVAYGYVDLGRTFAIAPPMAVGSERLILAQSECEEDEDED